jgi:hypothetical protein
MSNGNAPERRSTGAPALDQTRAGRPVGTRFAVTHGLVPLVSLAPGNSEDRREEKRKVLRHMQGLAWSSGCVACGETDVDVLEFNHVETPGSAHNKRTISRIISAALSYRVFVTELHKCVVMCANDHRRFTRGKLPLDPAWRRADEALPIEFRWYGQPESWVDDGYLTTAYRGTRGLVHRCQRNTATGEVRKPCQSKVAIALAHTTFLAPAPAVEDRCRSCFFDCPSRP